LDPDKTRRLEETWIKWGMGAPLVVLSSPYRSLLQPFLEYLNHLLALGDNHMVTIVIPEFVPAHWWQHLLHNQTALLIKGALLFRKDVIVTDVPYHLTHCGTSSASGGESPDAPHRSPAVSIRPRALDQRRGSERRYARHRARG